MIVVFKFIFERYMILLIKFLKIGFGICIFKWKTGCNISVSVIELLVLGIEIIGGGLKNMNVIA